MFPLCDKCGHKAEMHDERGDPMGCQVQGCPCREYKNFLPPSHMMSEAISKIIYEFRARCRDIPIDRNQAIEEALHRLVSEVLTLPQEEQDKIQEAIEQAQEAFAYDSEPNPT